MMIATIIIILVDAVVDKYIDILYTIYYGPYVLSRTSHK